MEQIKLFPKYLGALLLRVCIAVLIGTLLLSAVRLLPAAPMEKNLERSAPVFAEEGIYPSLFSWCTSQLDSTTDALILLISAYDSSENPVVQAMTGTWNTLSSEEVSSGQLAAHYGEGVPFDGSEPYYQYWHGYQLLIRPLLSLMGYQGIRILNGILQTGLLLILCLLLRRQEMSRLILPYLAAVAMLMPLALAMSLQFSSCYYILTLGSIAVVLRKNRLNQKDGFLFLFIGIATSYFDFLTYPVATLGIPAVFYFCIRKSTTIRDTFCRGVKICFSWAVGYVGMWAGKWLIGSLILGQNILGLAGSKLAERSSLGYADKGLLYGMRAALSANIKSFLKTPATLFAILLAVVILILFTSICRKYGFDWKKAISTFFPFAVIAVIPLAWFMVTSQHAVIHYWFTNKALVVSVFAGLAGLVCICAEAEKT